MIIFMRRNTIRVQLLAFALLLFSCSSMNKAKTLPVLSPFAASATIDLADVVDTVMYVQLDDSILLAGIGNLALTDSFIVGTSGENGIVRFDLRGNFHNAIGHIGQGPEEYQRGNYCMALDARNDIVYVFISPDILLSYSLAGDFLHRVHLQMPKDVSGVQYPELFRVQNGLLYFYYMNAGAVGEKPLYWMKMHKDGAFAECRQGAEKRKSFYEGVLLVNDYVSVNDSTMIYWDNFNDTVFHVNPSKETAAYLFDKGDFRIQETDVLSRLPIQRIRCSRIIDTEKFLLLSWVSKNRDVGTYYNLYDKHSGKTYKIRDDMIYDKRGDLSARYLWMSYICLKGREYLVTLTKAIKVVNILGALRYNLDIDDLEGNPVIALIRLKT